MLANLMLVIAAMVWGSAFVAQDVAAEHLGTFSINGIRYMIGALVLIPLILLLNFTKKEKRELFKKQLRPSLIGGTVCGIVLFIASSLQQIGIGLGTDAGKAGFITAMYIVIVPILGLFLNKKVTPLAWLAVIIAPIGLFLLCIKNDFSFSLGDIAIFACAIMFSCHILSVDRFSPKSNGVLLSSVQFFVCSVLSSITALFTEYTSMEAVNASLLPLLFLGLGSCGVAYTLQVIAQKMTEPTVASLLMSLESVFAVIFGAIILKQMLDTREIVGCLIIFAAVILSQLPYKRSK